MRTIITSKPCIVNLTRFIGSGIFYCPFILLPFVFIFTLDDCTVWWTKALNILALIITSIITLNIILWRNLGKEILSTDEENLIIFAGLIGIHRQKVEVFFLPKILNTNHFCNTIPKKLPTKFIDNFLNINKIKKNLKFCNVLNIYR